MNTAVKQICAACGSAPTNHFLERLDARLNHYLFPLVAPLSGIAKLLAPILEPGWRKLWPGLIKILVAWRLAQVKSAPDEKNNWRSRCLWEEAEKRGITMREFRPFGRYVDSYFAEFNGKIIFFDGLPRPLGKKSASLQWMDDKAEMAWRFQRQNIPIARGGVAKNLKQALKIFQDLHKTVITKPVTGSRGRHTTIHINTEKELAQGFVVAKQLSPWVVVQEELAGSVYRATVVGGKLIAVLRRDPAGVAGDGARSIRQLLEKENKNPLRQGPLFQRLPVDAEAEKELSRQNLIWESIPAEGVFIALGTKTSRGRGGALVDATDSVQADNKVLFEKIGAVLADPLVGIDFIIADIKKSWRETASCGVIECNSLPFIDLHHYPLQGEARNVAGAVWELILF